MLQNINYWLTLTFCTKTTHQTTCWLKLIASYYSRTWSAIDAGSMTRQPRVVLLFQCYLAIYIPLLTGLMPGQLRVALLFKRNLTIQTRTVLWPDLLFIPGQALGQWLDNWVFFNRFSAPHDTHPSRYTSPGLLCIPGLMGQWLDNYVLFYRFSVTSRYTSLGKTNLEKVCHFSVILQYKPVLYPCLVRYLYLVKHWVDG